MTLELRRFESARTPYATRNAPATAMVVEIGRHAASRAAVPTGREGFKSLPGYWLNG